MYMTSLTDYEIADNACTYSVCPSTVYSTISHNTGKSLTVENKHCISVVVPSFRLISLPDCSYSSADRGL